MCVFVCVRARAHVCVFVCVCVYLSCSRSPKQLHHQSPTRCGRILFVAQTG